jgi:hypothetical protein
MGKQTTDTGRKGPAYPNNSWQQCIKMAEAIKALGGDRMPVPKEDVAHHMGIATDSPFLGQTIASAKTFGMIEGHGEYELTENGRMYFYPQNDSEKRQAELAFFASPPAYKVIIDRFDGGILPQNRSLANILLKEGEVPQSWIDRAASQFKDTCAKLGLIDSGGHLRYSVATRGAMRAAKTPDAIIDLPKGNHVPVTTEEALPSTMREEKTKPVPSSRPFEVNTWSYSEAGGTVRVETPIPLPRALWERLKRYVDILEPFEEAKGGVDEKK